MIEADGPVVEATDEERAEARTQVAQLLERARIARVVCVDDEFEGDVEDLIAQCAALAAAGADAAAIAEVDLTLPREVWESDLRDAWDAMDPATRRLISSRARRLADGDTNDQPDAGALAALLPAEVVFQPVTPDEWVDSVGQQVLADAPKTGTLVLFDRNLGTKDGLRLVAALFEADGSQNLWAGLLTHTVTKESEHEEWQQLTRSEPSIDDERFVVISKQHLGPDPMTFPQSLKVTLMTRAAADLRDEVGAAIRESVEDALERIKQISPQEFERMVFLTSEREGVWEPDTLLRMFDICIRVNARKRLYESSRVRKDTSTLRQLASIRTKDAPTTTHAQTIMQSEIYEDPEHLNRVHLPIELGDLFQLTGTAKRFVLVEQPCDLMVRKEGTRAPEMFDLTLLPVLSDDQSKRKDCFELPAFNDDGTSGWVHLGRPQFVPVQAIDYCAFNDDGSSKLQPGTTAPALLWPVWKKRHERLMRDARKVIKAIVEVTDDHREIAIAAMLRTGKTHPVKGEVDDQRVQYKLHRVGRILPTYSRPLLTRYALHKAREAYEPRFVS